MVKKMDGTMWYDSTCGMLVFKSGDKTFRFDTPMNVGLAYFVDKNGEGGEFDGKVGTVVQRDKYGNKTMAERYADKKKENSKMSGISFEADVKTGKIKACDVDCNTCDKNLVFDEFAGWLGDGKTFLKKRGSVKTIDDIVNEMERSDGETVYVDAKDVKDIFGWMIDSYYEHGAVRVVERVDSKEKLCDALEEYCNDERYCVRLSDIDKLVKGNDEFCGWNEKTVGNDVALLQMYNDLSARYEYVKDLNTKREAEEMCGSVFDAEKYAFDETLEMEQKELGQLLHILELRAKMAHIELV